jgi:hypothetical protein
VSDSDLYFLESRCEAIEVAVERRGYGTGAPKSAMMRSISVAAA